MIQSSGLAEQTVKGAGKGSTTRQILPEEAVKLVKMLKDEARGKVKMPDRTAYPSETSDLESLNDHNGVPHEGYYMIDDEEKVKKEFYLNLYFSQNADENSSIQSALSDIYNVEDVEYLSSEYPVGAAGDEADFVVSFKKDEDTARYRLIIFDFKKDKVNNKSLAETMLYVPWIAQAFVQFSEPKVESLEIVSVLVGGDKTEQGKYALRRTEEYSFTEEYVSGIETKVEVKSSRVLTYSAKNTVVRNGDQYATELGFKDVPDEFEKVPWPHLKGLCKSDLDWIMNEIWNPAKKKEEMELSGNP